MVRDMRNTRPEKQSLTPMQKQAVLVCSVCALAAILTIAITMTLLKRGKTPAAPGEQPSSEVLVPGEEDISDHYQISETSAALLPETADAGESYQKETLFLGDSNTVPVRQRPDQPAAVLRQGGHWHPCRPERGHRYL